MNTVELWRVKVGSHCWNMQHAGSDNDYFACYAVDTNSILRGEVTGGGAHFSEKVVPGGDDVQSHEVGKWVEMARKGNFNYMVGVFSPIVVSDTFGYLAEFREICRRGIAKNVYHSIDGMARGNLMKYQKESVEDPVQWQKRVNACARSLFFGITWMLNGEPKFLPTKGVTEKQAYDLLDEFKLAYEASKLPETPPNELEYRDFLFKVRMARLKQKEDRIEWTDRAQIVGWKQ